MDVQSSAVSTPENTEPTPRGGNADSPAKVSTTLPKCNPVCESVYLPARLLDGIDLAAACSRRLLVTAWLLSGGEEGTHAARAAVRFWHGHRDALLSWRAATVTTVLFDLQALGLVESFSAAVGGFSVSLKEVVN